MATELFTTTDCQVLSLVGRFAPSSSEVNSQERIALDDVKAKLEKLDNNLPLIVILDSIGGAVYEATEIANLLVSESYKHNVTLLVANRAYSAATILTSVLAQVVAVSTARIMIHGVSLEISGEESYRVDACEARMIHDLLDRYNYHLASFYARKSDLSVTAFKSIIEREFCSPGELYLSAQGAKDLKLIDHIIEDVQTYFNNRNLTYPAELDTRYGKNETK